MPGALASSSPARSSAALLRERAACALVVAALAWLSARGWTRVVDSPYSDFPIYHAAARAVLAGRDPSAVAGYIYPSAAATCLVPLALLPLRWAAALWELASCAAALGVAWQCAQWAVDAREGAAGGASADELARARLRMFWLPLACVLRLADSNFGYGQVNLVVLGLVLLGLRALERGRELRAGAWIGLAAAWKLLPAIALALCAARRAGRACAAGLVCAALALWLLPMPFLGARGNAASLAHWFEQTALPYARGGRALLEAQSYVAGQSLTGLSYRLLCATPGSQGGRGASIQIADVDPERVAWLVRGLDLALLALLAWALLRPRRPWTRLGSLFALALALDTALLVAPLVHKAHLVWCLPAFAAAWRGASLVRAGRARALWLALLALAVALLALSTQALLGRGLARELYAYGAPLLGLLALHALLLWGLLAPPWRASARGG